MSSQIDVDGAAEAILEEILKEEPNWKAIYSLSEAIDLESEAGCNEYNWSAEILLLQVLTKEVSENWHKYSPDGDTHMFNYTIPMLDVIRKYMEKYLLHIPNINVE